MEILASFLIVIAFVTTLYPLRDVPDGEMIWYQEIPGTETEVAFKYNVKPLSVFSDENIVKQKFDYSCGSAALATVLNYHLGEDLSEQQVIQGLMEYGDTKLIEQRRAFSLLDMKRFVSILGYEGAGYTAEMNDLTGLDTPCIVPIEFYGYKHFVVYRGAYKGHIFVADPYMGNMSYTIQEFEQMWYRNIIFLVTDGGATTDALLLKEDDLRIVDFDSTTDAFPSDIPLYIIENEERFIESLGRYRFRNKNVH